MADNAFYIILIIVLLIAIFIFWRKNQKPQLSYYDNMNMNIMPNSPVQMPNPPMYTPNSPMQTMQDQSSISAMFFEVLQRASVALQPKIAELKQTIMQSAEPYAANIRNYVDKLVPELNKEISVINSNIQPIVLRLNQEQKTRLERLLLTFNKDIDDLNNAISRVTGQRVNLITMPSAAPIYQTQIDCGAYHSDQGGYCLGQIDDRANFQMCYHVNDASENDYDISAIGNARCSGSDSKCQQVLNLCTGKPICQQVASSCDFNSIQNL